MITEDVTFLINKYVIFFIGNDITFLMGEDITFFIDKDVTFLIDKDVTFSINEDVIFLIDINATFLIGDASFCYYFSSLLIWFIVEMPIEIDFIEPFILFYFLLKIFFVILEKRKYYSIKSNGITYTMNINPP